MIKEIYEHLVSDGETALGVSVKKGFPDFTRTDLPLSALPIAAVELAAGTPGRHNRIGSPQAQQAALFRVYIFARHEPELCELLESLANWTANLGRVVVNSRQVAFQQQDWQRHQPVTNAQQEMHAFWINVQATW